jgi:hypothetical protein
MDLLSAASIDAELDRTFGRTLAAEGFTAVRPRFWVRPGPPPVRHLVRIEALKGARYAPAWGISLDYVPHVEGRHVRWHRTNRSARFDLIYDTVDHEPGKGWFLDGFASDRDFGQRCGSLTPRLVAAATAFMAPLTSDASVLEAFEDKRRRPTTRCGFENYHQNVLAYAFTLARVRDIAAGEEWLDRYLGIYGVDDQEVARTLLDLLHREAAPGRM